MKRILIILSIVFPLAGCSPDFTENNLIEMHEISLVWKGAIQVRFDEATGQLGYNDLRHEYRVYNDKLADWFTLRCSADPVHEGQTLSGDVSWTGEKSPKAYNGLSFLVKKISPEGMIWLWNENEKLGIIIKDIR